MREKFAKNVDYLKRNIPPDDIYEFAEQTFMAAMFFMYKWSDWTDLIQESENDDVAKKWIANIVGLHHMKVENIDVDLDLNMKSIEEDDEINS